MRPLVLRGSFGRRRQAPIGLGAGLLDGVGQAPHFATAPAILSRTDLLLTVPRVALHGLVGPFGLAERPVPVDLAPMPLAVHWSAVHGGDPAVVWFRSRVEQVLRQLLEAGPLTVRAGGALG